MLISDHYYYHYLTLITYTDTMGKTFSYYIIQSIYEKRTYCGKTRIPDENCMTLYLYCLMIDCE